MQTLEADFVAEASRPKKVIINGKTFTFGGIDPQGNPIPKPRLTWTEISRLAVKRNTNLLTIMVTAPGGTPHQLIFGHSLIITDGMTIEVT